MPLHFISESLHVNITSIRSFFDSSLSIIKDMSAEKGIINTFITDRVSKDLNL